MWPQHAQSQGTQKQYASMQSQFITVEIYILFDDPSTLFHHLYMVPTSNFQFLGVKNKRKSILVYVMKAYSFLTSALINVSSPSHTPGTLTH